MQTIMIIAIFSMVIAIMGSMISNGTSNSKQLVQDRVTETRQFFDSVAKVVRSEITPDYFEGNPNGATTPADYIKGLQQLKLLSTGRMSDPSLDAWGRPIDGRIFTSYQSLTSSTDSRNKVLVPVTGFLFVSSGPDGILQTTIPTITNLSGIYGVVAAGDDIVYSFDNRRAQEDMLKSIDARMQRIGTAALKELQSRVAPYRQAKLAAYQAQVANGKDVSIDTLDITHDVNAPTFIDLGSTSQGLDNRLKLGVDEEFTILEARTPTNKQMALTTEVPATLSDPLVIEIKNNANRPTPWGNPASGFVYTVYVSAVTS